MVVEAADIVSAPVELGWGTPTYAEHREKNQFKRNLAITHQETGFHVSASFSFAEQGGWSPRHHHVFSQVRYIMKGHPYYDGKKYGPGDVMYVPEGVYYGPHTRPEDGVEQLTFQFPGPSGTSLKFPSEEFQRGIRELKAKGVVFKDGVAHWPDGKKQDSSEAIHEHIAGREMVYAPPITEDPVQIHSTNFPWRAGRVPGVAYKHLGYFNECGPNLTIVKMEPGATIPGGRVPCIDLRIVIQGELEYQGRSCPAVTRLYVPPGSDFEEMSSRSGAEILVFQVGLPGGEVPPLHVV
jgi:hypothetical protein